NGTGSFTNAIHLDGGTTNIGSVLESTGYYISVGHLGTGVLNLAAGGKVSAANSIYLGRETDSKGTISVSGAGSVLNTSNYLDVGYAGAGTLNLTAGGKAISAKNIQIGRDKDSEGTVTVSGTGSELKNASGDLFVGYYGTGKLDLSAGGKASLASNIYIGHYGTGDGTVTVDGAGALLENKANIIYIGNSGKGVLNLTNGGKVTSAVDIRIGQNTNSSGTVTVGKDSEMENTGGRLFVGDSGTGVLNVTDGGKVTSNSTITIGHLGGNGTVTVGKDSVLKNLDGTVSHLTISYNNTSTGTLKLEEGGKASIANDIYIGNGGAATVMVGAGSTLESRSGTVYLGGNASRAGGPGLLAGSGNLAAANVTAWSKGTLSPGDTVGATGTLTFSNNLTLNGATLSIDLGAGNISDKLAIGGKLTLGTQGNNTLNFASLVEGEYTIATFNSCDRITTSNDNFKLLVGGNAFSKRQAVSFANSTESSIIINVFNDGNMVLTWTGDTSANWQSIDTGDENWTDGTAGGETRFRNGDSVVFDATGSNKNISIQDGGLSVAAMTVSGDADYTFSNGDLTGSTAGTTIIGATGALLKSGDGTLTLNNNASFTSATLSGGTLQIGGTFTGDITNNATLIFNNPGASTYSDDISGSGSLTKNGGGTLTLSGTNTYEGQTSINAGKIIGNTASLGSTSKIWGDTGTTVEFNQTTNDTFGKTIEGDLAFEKSGGGTLTLSGANTYTGGTTVSAGTLIGTTSSLQGDITNNSNLQLNQNSDGIYSGSLSGSGAFIKTGIGNLTLNQDLAQGSVSLNDGALSLAAGKTLASTFMGGMETTLTVNGGNTITGNTTFGQNMNLVAGLTTPATTALTIGGTLSVGGADTD
ncbi:autotransporter-associated beta strand repeat-containing protein, partial [Desulfococcaceae bacterium OttesenSCG-928-F15]|nr:autotransporter-associated beta strand repeat-containing protein [Desulfococcaceae bacterium OttesenSCG-928-F15]